MSPTQIIHNQLTLIDEVTRNEQWLEGERRGCFVPRDDIAVQMRVFTIAMECGEKWRAEVIAAGGE